MPFLSHYGDIPDISGHLSITCLVFLILTPTVVVFRLAVSYHQSKFLHADDWFIILSTICVEVLGILLLLCAAGAFGKHQKDLPLPLVEKTLEMFTFAQVAYKLSLALTKFSVLCFYQRMFNRHRVFILTCRTLGAAVLLWSVASFFATIFQCTPVAYAWTNADHHEKGSCINIRASWLANASFNIVTDTAIVLLPIWVIRKIQMRLKDKVALCALFGLGFIVIICSILRATTLHIATGDDRTWVETQSSGWSECEASIAIIGSCLPMIKGFITRSFRATSKSSNQSTSNDTTIDEPITGNGRHGAVYSGPVNRSYISSTCNGPAPNWVVKLWRQTPFGRSRMPKVWRSTALSQTVEYIGFTDLEHASISSDAVPPSLCRTHK